MRVTTDDDVYRVDAVWLGPPRFTFPWRARYTSYALGLGVLVVVMAVERRLGVAFGLWSTAWALVAAVAVARLAGRRTGEEEPLAHVVISWWNELRTPRPGRRWWPR